MNQPLAVTDPRARFWGNALKYAALLVVGFLVAPYIWVSIGGLIGLAVAAGLIIGTWLIRRPLFSWAANARLKLIKAEAGRNPVETLQEEQRQESARLEEKMKSIQLLKANLLTFEDKLAELKARSPGAPQVAKFERDIKTIEAIIEHRIRLWKKAREELDRFAEQIDVAGMIWETAQAAAAAHATAGLSAEDEFFSRLRKETAFDSIKLAYNEAVASLDVALAEKVETAPESS